MSTNWNGIRERDLPTDLRTIYKKFGADVVAFLIDEFGGGSLYVPSMRSYRARVRDELIAKEFDGTNIASLARKFGVSRRYVRIIIKKQSDTA